MSTTESISDSTIAEPMTIPIDKISSRVENKEVAEVAEISEKTEGDVRPIKGFRWILVCISLYITCFLYGLDTTIAADVQGSVVEALGHIEQLAWIGAGFPLGSVAVIVPLTAAFTNFNLKWTFIVTVIIFEVGSVLCGAAPNMNAMIIGRVIAGMGGTGIYLGCLNYFSSLTTPKERGTYITLIGFCWGIGAVLGPVVGVIGGALTPIYLFLLPPLHPVKGVSIRTRLLRLDFVGFILGAAVWATFALALTMAGGQWPWNDGRTIAMFVVFGVLVIGYALQQRFCIFTTPETRSFPIKLLFTRTHLLLYVAMSANSATMFVFLYFFPIYFQFVHNDTALEAAVRLLPYVIITVTFNLAAGRLLSKVKRYMPIYVISGVFLTIGGSFMVAYLKPSTSISVIYGLSVLNAVGTGLTLQIGYAVASLVVDPKDIGDAISLQNFSQIGSNLISLVIAGQIFQSVAVRNLEKSTLFQQLSGELRNQAVHAITQAIQQALILLPVGGGVILLAALIMKRERLFGEIVVVGA
ncbi:major facilitator superfamily domain-containing protein [Trichoderma breve]|uniref:Major facilitator superfamily domain-containing protein n=1 Tax=Trichoderma breve TaxID=2034170 RepID=A0A9W9BBD9_9HYPO|nr:major facilitator superfamily domain-containing protein [Trichoderma breve]KAJ4859367.1 major facilitator superfamily domain-containing protein [Trichoderma breve]